MRFKLKFWERVTGAFTDEEDKIELPVVKAVPLTDPDLEIAKRDLDDVKLRAIKLHVATRTRRALR